MDINKKIATRVGEFLFMFVSDLFSIMSGSLSVIFALLGAFDVSSNRILFLNLAFAAFFINVFMIWNKERSKREELENKIQPKIITKYDETNLQCKADVTWEDGTKAVIFRIFVYSIGTKPVDVEGYLTELWKNNLLTPIGSTRLTWVASIEHTISVNIYKGVPRSLDVCIINEMNKISVPAENGAWPPNNQKTLFDDKGIYRFKITIKSLDDAEPCDTYLDLDWTGDWRTAKMTCSSISS